ncbi:hypothetical protein BYT27DRAFT_6746760 [Phlegmacium glaucopus]|nr:hypothetical protein BYT27DRAFT_6746760 [Phlegmacium glaucopus]
MPFPLDSGQVLDLGNMELTLFCSGFGGSVFRWRWPCLPFPAASILLDVLLLCCVSFVFFLISTPC